MLCRLLLMRHAKSLPSETGMSDHERPLNEKGSGDAKTMAKQILAAEYNPKTVLCSDSKRTLETWEGITSRFPHSTFIKSSVLYCSDVDSYISFMTANASDKKTMLVIGHNPTMEDLVFHLSRKSIVMKPANLAVLEAKADTWEQALSRPAHWELIKVLAP